MTAPPRVPQAVNLELDGFTGFTEVKPSDRLAKAGPNELPSSESRGLLVIILTNRSWTATAVLALVLSWPLAQRFFHFGPLHGSDLLLAGTAGFVSVLWYDALKGMRRVRGSL